MLKVKIWASLLCIPLLFDSEYTQGNSNSTMIYHVRKLGQKMITTQSWIS